MDQKNDYEQLDSIPIPHHKTGRPVGRFAATGRLLMPGRRDTLVDNMCDMAADFVKVFDPAVTLFKRANGREIGIAGDNWRTYYATRDPKKDDYASFFINLKAKGKIPPVHLDMHAPYSNADWTLECAPYGVCAFHFRLPPLKKAPKRFIQHIRTWCSILRPEQGTFGIGLVCDPFMIRKFTINAWPYLARFSGLDHPTLLDWSAPDFHVGLRAVNWLTVLDDAWVDRLGGQDEIVRHLHPEGLLHPYDGGVIVQACAHPQLGDINLKGIPEAYAAVDALIAPHRYVDYPDKPMHLFKVPPPLDPYVTTLEWLRRFEPKDEE